MNLNNRGHELYTCAIRDARQREKEQIFIYRVFGWIKSPGSAKQGIRRQATTTAAVAALTSEIAIIGV